MSTFGGFMNITLKRVLDKEVQMMIKIPHLICSTIWILMLSSYV